MFAHAPEETVVRHLLLSMLGNVLSLAVLAFPHLAVATTWRTVELTCPIDETKVSARVTQSTFIPGIGADLRPRGVDADIFLNSMAQCPKCGFVTHYGRFEKSDGLDRKRALRALNGLKKSHLFHKYDAAIACEQNWTNSEATIAHLTLGGKWLADDTGEADVIRERTGQTIFYR